MATDAPERSEKEIASDLVTRIGHGDHVAEAAMIQRYGRGLLYLLRRKCRDRALADDLYQDSFRIALERLRASEMRNPEMLASFLHGIASNLVISYYRREHSRATDTDLAAIDRIPARSDQFDSLSREQVAKTVRRLLDELTQPRDREILMRVFLDDQDKTRVCAELGLDSLHFNRILFRAKQRLKTLFLQVEGRERLRLVSGGGTDSLISGQM